MTTHPSEILTVSELTAALKLLIERNFAFVSLQGEVSNCKLQTSGHLYFSLKDTHAAISCVMFRKDVNRVPLLPKEGAQVIIQGELTVFPPSGKYQIVVKELRLAGIGELLLKLETLKRQLHQLGWFKKERKKPLPKFPKRIGVVTSATGAVIQDILHVLSRRHAGFQLLLNPVKVQGVGAAEEIAEAIRQFNRHQLADVIIVGRGGGSIEDLFAFNELIVAEAVYESQIPIICAVGHETDHCIAEYVADARAPTPSAAAEIVIAEKSAQLIFLEEMHKRMSRALTHKLLLRKQKLEALKRLPLFQSPYVLLGPRMQRLDHVRSFIAQSTQQIFERRKLLLQSKRRELESLNPKKRLHFYKNTLLSLEKALNQAMRAHLETKKSKLLQTQEMLGAINPKRLLSKGYTILFQEKTHSVINSIQTLEKGQKVRMLLADGQALSTITDIIS